MILKNINKNGINFIEYRSFKPFNEGTRLINSGCYSRTLFGKITHISADDIYATNASRKYCTQQKIIANFRRKDRAGKHEIIARSSLRNFVKKEQLEWKEALELKSSTTT